MKLVSWNVNGIRASYPKGLSQFIQSYSPDILCLQETKAMLEQVSPEVQTLGYPYSIWSSAKRKGYSGVATFSKKSFISAKKGWGQEEYESEGRIIITQFSSFDLYNIYFPNGGSGEERHLFKQKFLLELNVQLKSNLEQRRPIIVVGDYNVAPYPIDVYDPNKLSKESGFLPEERDWFQSFFELGFIDSFRLFYPDKKDVYSWWSYREFARVTNRGWRIDFICFSHQLLPYIKGAFVHDDIAGSDHCPVSVDLDEKLFF